MAKSLSVNVVEWPIFTADLTLEQEAAYLRLLSAAAHGDGKAPASVMALCGMWRCNARRADRLLRELVAAGKVQVAGKWVICADPGASIRAGSFVKFGQVSPSFAMFGETSANQPEKPFENNILNYSGKNAAENGENPPSPPSSPSPTPSPLPPSPPLFPPLPPAPPSPPYNPPPSSNPTPPPTPPSSPPPRCDADASLVRSGERTGSTFAGASAQAPAREAPPGQGSLLGDDDAGSLISIAVAAYNRLAKAEGWILVAAGRPLSAARRAALRGRISDAGGLSAWIQTMGRAVGNSFLRGQNNRGWRPDLDFFIRAATFTRLSEGYYDQPAQQSGREGFAGRYDPSPSGGPGRDRPGAGLSRAFAEVAAERAARERGEIDPGNDFFDG